MPVLLTETHVIRRRRNEDLFDRIDAHCFSAKNLHNSVNYLISQCARISRKLEDGEILDSREKYIIYKANCGIWEYNRIQAAKKKDKKPVPLRYIDRDNGFIADAWFLSWYLKGTENYRAMPYATCAQICIQEVCRDWKSFYKGMRQWKKDPSGMTGRPGKPGYLDKEKGRSALVITSQNFSLKEDGTLKLPGFLEGLVIKPEHEGIHQIRIVTEEDRIRVMLIYKKEEKKKARASGCMGIDLGINNLAAVCTDTGAAPLLIDGKTLKSANRYYNRKKAKLQSAAKSGNGRNQTKRIRRLTEKRNRKIRDRMHKASRLIVQHAEKHGIGLIVIGNNRGWKKGTDMGKITNQAFTGIPHYQLIEMIRYKAELSGIRVMIVEESYTSGTSFLDGETPKRKNYDKSRRIKRGLFVSNNGTCINADVNAAYQMMKKAGKGLNISRTAEMVTRIYVV